MLITANKNQAKLVAVHLPNLNGGGAEKVAIILCEQLHLRGYKIDLVVGTARGEYVETIPAGINVVDLGAPRTWKSITALRKYIEKSRPAAIIANVGPQNISAVIANALSQKKTNVFAVQHSSLTHQSRDHPSWQMRAMPILYRFVLPFSSGVVAVSHGVAEDLIEKAHIPRNLVKVIYNPITSPTKEQYEGPISIPEFFDGQEPVIAALGRLVPVKDFTTLIKAVHLINQTTFPTRLLVMGNGPMREQLQMLVESLNLSERVRILPFSSNPYPYLKEASVTVMSSRYEGFGNVLVESMACGTPVVSTNCPFGPAEILENGKYGHLTPVGDVEALAEAIVATIRNPISADVLKSRARTFEPSAAVESYIRLLRL